MICPICESEMVEVEGIVNRTTNPNEEDQYGSWYECLTCGYTEDITEGGE